MVLADKVRARIREEIYKRVPPEAQLVKIEFEGPEIAIYVRNVKFIIEREDIVKSLAKTLRKRIVVRVDESARLPQKEALRKILSILPTDVEIEEDDITFDEVLGEVVIRTSDPRKFYQDDKL